MLCHGFPQVYFTEISRLRLEIWFIHMNPKTLKIKVYNWILAVECPSGIYLSIITEKDHAIAVRIGNIE